MDRSKSILSISAYALYVHFGLQLVAGALLATVYRGTAADAHSTTASLHTGAWAVLQGFHYWGSAVMIVHSALHFAGVTWAGWYRGALVRGYFAALALFGLSLGFQVSGNALPWDRHGVQTVAVEGAIAARVPVVGSTVSKVMLGGEVVSPATLGVWYTAHWLLLPIALLAVLALGWSVPRVKEAKWRWAVPASIALLLGILIASPFGSAASPEDFGRFDAKPSWYTVPMHGLLVWGDRLVPGGGWIGAALVPGLIVTAFILLPLLKRTKRSIGRGLLLGFGLIGVFAAITSGGESASLVGTRDPKIRPKIVAEPTKDVKDAVLAAKGKALFASQGCNNCHGVDGLKGVGGPSLKDTWKERPKADFYMKYVKNPASVEPGSTMPAYPNLKEQELRAMAEFLRFPR